ncbi:uncharacterized protein G2W53_028508 [Senna tora]|uniref:Uncharacterized protein n=1 Tax=Senna tora TaxID=362788 RepID=A0A834T2G2_9FABA|nr:uncharacterized protein G2W53_028508 [Senna tora]
MEPKLSISKFVPISLAYSKQVLCGHWPPLLVRFFQLGLTNPTQWKGAMAINI